MNHAYPQPGTILAERFRVGEVIGRGGMGVVLAAENIVTRRRVAIKWLRSDLIDNAEAAERLVREASVASRIRHPNVVDVFDVLRDGTSIFLVMDLLQGESMEVVLHRGGIPLHELVAMLLPAMRGVAEAHRQDIVHRDIHPGNIFLSRESHDPRPVPMVLDFGISKFGNVGAEQRALTRSNMCMGTPLYMSYEQLYSARDVDARTDVYSFGVILYEGLTGKPPFDGESLMEVAGKITAGIPVHPKKLRPEIPTALAEIVLWAMARKREDRIPTMEAFIRELEPFATERAFRAQMTDVEQVLPNVPRAERFAEAIPIDDEVESVDTPAAPLPPPLPSGRPSAEPIAPLATLASRPALSKEVDTLGQRTSKLAQSMRPPPPDERRRRTTRLAAAGIALLVGGAAVVWKVSEHGTSQQPPAANVASDPSDSALPAAQLDTPLATAPASGASQALPPQHAADAAGRPDAAAASSTQSAPGANSKDAPASIPVASVASRRASGTAAVSLTPRPPIKSRPAQKATPPLPPRRAGELKIKDLY